MSIKELITIAIENKQFSYSPYSNFKVSSVVYTEDGEIYTGVNIENASYPVSICAERVAISKAISKGNFKIKFLIIVGDAEYTMPCGICKQFMSEFLTKDSKIVIAKNEEEYKVYSMEDLLPYSFSKKDLN